MKKLKDLDLAQVRLSPRRIAVGDPSFNYFLDFDEVANVETTKTAGDVPMTTNAQNQTA